MVVTRGDARTHRILSQSPRAPETRAATPVSELPVTNGEVVLHDGGLRRRINRGCHPSEVMIDDSISRPLRRNESKQAANPLGQAPQAAPSNVSRTHSKPVTRDVCGPRTVQGGLQRRTRFTGTTGVSPTSCGFDGGPAPPFYKSPSSRVARVQQQESEADGHVLYRQ